jgi:CubicO group peptidase (beta-lactamase class C family)
MRTMTTLLAVFLAQPAMAQPTTASQAVLDGIIAPLATPGSPGCAVAAAEKGKRIATAAFGQADLEHGVRNSPDSVFEAGSVSKQFTAAAILLLAKDGKIALNDDVRKYLPELPDYGTPIRINHLLSHTSGLRDWGQVALIGGWERSTRAYDNVDVLHIVARQKALNYKPGDEYSYTNSGYNLMALIVERVSGQSLATFTKARLFGPLGMYHTQWRDDFRRVVSNHAIAYDRTGSDWKEARPFEDAYANGGLLTTVGDLLIWNQALSTGRLGAGIAEAMQEKAALNDGRHSAYARGLTVGRYRGVESFSHSGATGGYRAWLERLTANGLSIAVLCNGGSFNAVKLGRDFADTRIPKSASEEVPSGLLAKDDPRLGSFVSEATGKLMRLSALDGGLKPEDGPALVEVSPGFFSSGDTQIAFTSADGFLYSTPDGGRTTFVRAARFTPDAATLASYAGRYASDEADAVYEVSPEGNALRLTLVARPKIRALTAPLYPDAFVSGDTLLRFRRDASGRVVAMSFGVSRVRDLPFFRVKQ